MSSMQEFITRAEHERALDRVEGRVVKKQDDILAALHDGVSEIKATMNGQFARQGQILAQHERRMDDNRRDIAVLQDRSGRDITARVYAAIGAFLALVAGYVGMKP